MPFHCRSERSEGETAWQERRDGKIDLTEYTLFPGSFKSLFESVLVANLLPLGLLERGASDQTVDRLIPGLSPFATAKNLTTKNRVSVDE